MQSISGTDTCLGAGGDPSKPLCGTTTFGSKGICNACRLGSNGENGLSSASVGTPANDASASPSTCQPGEGCCASGECKSSNC